VSQFRLQVLPGWNTTLLPNCIILLVYLQEDCGVTVPAAGVAWLEHNPASQLYNIAGISAGRLWCPSSGCRCCLAGTQPCFPTAP